MSKEDLHVPREKLSRDTLNKHYAITSIITIAVWTFSYVFVMTNGGPGNATMTADLYIYQNAFTVSQMNLAASAATLVLLAAVAVVVVAAMLGRLLRRGERA